MDMSQGNSQAAFDFFNNPLNHQASTTSTSNISSSSNNDASPTPQTLPTPPENEAPSRAKRTACTLCRKRKLRCDGARPSCATCSRLGHDCRYDEVRKKSGPKRGYVKVLEARLAQVESLLKTQDSVDGNDMEISEPPVAEFAFPESGREKQPEMILLPSMSAVRKVPQEEMSVPSMDSYRQDGGFAPQSFSQRDLLQQDFSPESFSWDMIALGLEEPLPAPEVQDDLYLIFFARCHVSMPTVHQGRFFAAMDLAPQSRPPVCLRYAMWANAAMLSNSYARLKDHFYRRARKYLEIDEMRGNGEAMVTLAHCQTWILVAMFEFQHMHFPRAWLSTGRAIRLAQMGGLDRVDNPGLGVKETMLPPKDWTEKEERRRAYWATYWCDRCASIGTGWPMMIDERDIRSNLPASEEAFRTGTPETSATLAEALEGRLSTLSPYAASIIMACMFGRNLTHLHRPTPDDRPGDLNGQFWMRHRKIDSILTNISLNLPDRLRLGGGNPEPLIVFLNMCIHTSTICLHQAAISKADVHQLAPQLIAESKLRCITAAGQTASIMRAVCHMDLSSMNPFMAFCLYVAGRVFVQYLRARPNDQQTASSFHFLLSAMHALQKKNPLNCSFLAQLEMDMLGAGLRNPYAERNAQDALANIDISPRLPRGPAGAMSVFADVENTVKYDDCLGGFASTFEKLPAQNQGTSSSYTRSGNTGTSESPVPAKNAYNYPGWKTYQQPAAPAGPTASQQTPNTYTQQHRTDSSSGLITELSPANTNDTPSLQATGSSRESFSTPHSSEPTPAGRNKSPFGSLTNTSPDMRPPSYAQQQTMEMPLHGGAFTPSALNTDDFADFNNPIFSGFMPGGGSSGMMEEGDGMFNGYSMSSMQWTGLGDGAGGAGGTGMTPASGDQWAQMMESINEWDGNLQTG